MGQSFATMRTPATPHAHPIPPIHRADVPRRVIGHAGSRRGLGRVGRARGHGITDRNDRAVGVGRARSGRGVVDGIGPAGRRRSSRRRARAGRVDDGGDIDRAGRRRQRRAGRRFPHDRGRRATGRRRGTAGPGSAPGPPGQVRGAELPDLRCLQAERPCPSVSGHPPQRAAGWDPCAVGVEHDRRVPQRRRRGARQRHRPDAPRSRRQPLEQPARHRRLRVRHPRLRHVHQAVHVRRSVRPRHPRRGDPGRGRQQRHRDHRGRPAGLPDVAHDARPERQRVHRRRDRGDRLGGAGQERGCEPARAVRILGW